MLLFFPQIQTDLHLIVVVLSTTGIIVFLLLLGEAIPHLRDDVRLELDLENPYGVNVSYVSAFSAYSNNYTSCDWNDHNIINRVWE